MKNQHQTTLTEIELILIDEPKKGHRQSIDTDQIKELASSIQALGLLQPILVCQNENRYEIVYGHRRFLAHKYLGLTKIMANVKDLSESEICLMRATENLSREDISPVEEGRIYDSMRKDMGMSIDDIGRKMGRSVGLIRRRLDLLKMPEVLQNAVHKKQIKYGVAEDLWSLGDQGAIEYYLGFAIEHGATVAVTRQWVKEWKDQKRRERSDVGGGRDVLSPAENRPVYVACDLCKEAMEIGKEVIIRGCPDCIKAMVEIIKNG